MFEVAVLVSFICVETGLVDVQFVILLLISSSSIAKWLNTALFDMLCGSSNKTPHLYTPKASLLRLRRNWQSHKLLKNIVPYGPLILAGGFPRIS